MRVFEPEQWGARGSIGWDDHSAIQKAIDACYSAGGGVVRLLPRTTYGIRSTIVCAPGVRLSGGNMATSIIRLDVDDIRAFRGPSTYEGGRLEVSDLTIWGFADRNPTQGSSASTFLTNFMNLDEVSLQRVRAVYGRSFGLVGNARRVEVVGCQVERCYRDGINFTGSDHVYIAANTVHKCGDDGIAVHVPSSSSGVLDKSTRIIGNRLYKCCGIKVLGGQNVVISNNELRFYSSYGCWIGRDSNFNEGNTTKQNIIINSNIFTDGISASVLGLGTVNSAIFINGSSSLGSGPNAIPSAIGTYDSTEKIFILPDPYINKSGETWPRGPMPGLVISNNVMHQTLSGYSKFSDSGYGTLWNSSGETDPDFTTNIREISGVLLSGSDLDGGIIIGNNFNGVSRAVAALNCDSINGLIISNNSVFRSRTGIEISASSAKTFKVGILANNFDIDPYMEASTRTSPLDGSWSSTTDTSWNAVSLFNVSGVIAIGNSFRNCQRDIRVSASSALSSRNLLFWDWSSGAKGIGAIYKESGNVSLFTDSDPTSVNYGKHSANADSGFLQAASTMPSTGYFRIGQFVENSSPSISAGKLLRGWLRLTNGAEHVLGTDWAAVYVDTTA